MAAAVDSTAEAVDTTVAKMVTAAETMDTTVAAMGIGVEIMGTTVDTKGITVDTMDTIGIMAMDTTAAAGGTRGSSVLDGVIRGTGIRTMGMGIPTTAPITITTLTPATTEIPATTDIRIITIRITTGITARPTATPDILITDIGMELVTAEDIMRIPARGIATGVECITADSADQVNGGAPLQVRRFGKASAVSGFC